MHGFGKERHCLSSFPLIQQAAMAKNCWLVKQEPESYSWADLKKDGRTQWTGVRNFQARNNLRAMKKGDYVLFYHSVSEKRVVGLARVDRENYPDPTAEEGDWSVVDIAPVKDLKVPVTLEAIKADKALKDILLVRHSRLSVMPVTQEQFARILALAETKV
jgi:predicted RNA-binding protein with PUA-like domain